MMTKPLRASLVWAAVQLLLLLCVLQIDAFAEQGFQSAFAPRDLFPFNAALPQLETEFLAPDQQWAFAIDSGWSNTSNRERGAFFIDAESRLIEPRLAIRVAPRWQFGVRLPFLWRGGGVLDESIYQWHQFFGLPQGPRDNRGGRRDLFLIEAEGRNGEELSIRSKGFGLGDLNTHLSLDLFEPSARSSDRLFIGLQLPTGREEFGLEGPAFSLGVSSRRRFNAVVAHFSAQYSLLSDVDFGDFEYKRHMYSALAGASLPFRWAELYLGLLFHSDLLANVPDFPSYQLYLDTGLRVPITESTTVSLLLRENPAPDTGTADVSAFLSLSYAP